MRIDIEAMFSMGLINSPMHGADINICGGNFVVAKPYGIQNGVDYALTGEIRKVNSEAILAQLACQQYRFTFQPWLFSYRRGF